MFFYIFFVFFHNRYRKDKVIKEDSRITWECKKGKKNRFLLTLRYVVPETKFKIALEGNGLKLYFISSFCLKIQFWELNPSLNHSRLKWKNTIIKWGYESQVFSISDKHGKFLKLNLFLKKWIFAYCGKFKYILHKFAQILGKEIETAIVQTSDVLFLDVQLLKMLQM